MGGGSFKWGIPDISTLTEFEAFASTSTQSTTSNGWVTKNDYPYTSIEKTPGVYVIDYTALVTNSDKQKAVGLRVQWREDSGAWQTIHDTRNGVASDDEYDVRTSFALITVTTDATIGVRMQFGQTDDGGTGRIKDTAIKIGKVSES